MTAHDLDRLLRLRLVVARYGEMDLMRWWNTKGQLGRLGAVALRRGFQKTHRFAAARSIFAVAAHRCAELLGRTDVVTLWHLPPALEEDFDAHWEHWLDHACDWEEYFARLETPAASNLLSTLVEMAPLTSKEILATQKLAPSIEEHAVKLPGAFRPSKTGIALLASAFALGRQGALTVPYARIV